MAYTSLDGSEKKTLKVAMYLRVSTEDQAMKFGLEMQRSAIEMYVKSKGHYDDGTPVMELAGDAYVYSDDGISGTTDLRDRNGFAQLMEDILNAPKGKKPFDIVAVYKVDRFARRLKILIQTIEFFRDHNIQFVSVNESIDTSTPFGRAILNIMGVIAELEIETISMRTQDGRKSSFKKGIYQSAPPFGYDKDANKRLIVHPQEAELVQQIFHWFVFENMSTSMIAKKLKNENVVTPRVQSANHDKAKGGPKKRHGNTFWRDDTIRDILKNEVYLGIYLGGKSKDGKRLPRDQWNVSDYRHQSLIEKAVFQKAQEKLTASAKKVISHRKNERQYLLRSLLRCGYCRKNEEDMLVWHGVEQKKNGKTSYYYKCGGKTTAKHDVTCTTLPIPGDQLEEYVVGFVRSLLEKPEETYQYQLNLHSTKTRVKSLQRERSRLIDELNKIPVRRENISNQHEWGDIPNIEEYQLRLKKIGDDEKRFLNRVEEIDQLLGQQALSEGYTKSFSEYSHKYSKALEKAFDNFDEVFTLLHSLIDRIIIYSRPVDHQFDKIAGVKKMGQQMPNEIEIRLKLPQQMIADLVEAKFAPKTDAL